jgi:ribosome recycling factor
MVELQIEEATSKMKKAVAATQDEFGHIRTGRASPHLLDRIEIDYYGARTPLNQIAGISVPEARMMVISPYDKSALTAIEKALQQSDLGVNPNNDGSIIRLNFPPLTEERRKILIKQVKERAEDGKIAVRNVRRHAKVEMEKMQKDGEISEDDLKRSEKELQKVTDHFVEEIDKMFGHKEQELLEV